MNRREFIGGVAGAGCCAAAGGCRAMLDAQGLCGCGRDYFCTWETQRATRKVGQSERDNLDENTLFSEGGWARELFPRDRRDLLLVVDDGWDVPYGAVNAGAGHSAFGRMALNESRFPSFAGSDTRRLRAFGDAVRDCGWRGAGLWIAAQAEGERPGLGLPRERVAEHLKRRLGESADAGIGYWKVDWGVHAGDLWFRETMSDLAASYAPDRVIEHSLGFNNALNGVAYPDGKPRLADGSLDLVGETGRMLGNPGFDDLKRRYSEIMAFSDSFRTYDTLGPMTTATAVERAVFALACADATRSGCTVNVEDEPVLGAALGLGVGIMRAGIWPDPAVPEPSPKHRRLAEVSRCVAWRRYAPVFGSDRGCPVRYSEAAAEERWHFADKSTWWSAAFGRTLFQRAPSVVSRGVPLPEVSLDGDERPVVCASMHPDTEATCVASIPILTQTKGWHTPECGVALDAALDRRRPLGVFGRFGSVTVKCRDRGRIFARDLLADGGTEITGRCRFAGEDVVLPGELLARIGVSAADDGSSPGVVVYME